MADTDDKRKLLANPLHGIVIPIGLLLFGTWLFSWSYMPYTIAFIIIICSIQYYLATQRRSSMHQTIWRDFELIDRTMVAPMTAIYRFKLGREDEILDIPTGHHLSCVFTIDGKDELRYYSPISNQFDAGFFDILVKHYPHGKVTSKLASVQIGQTVKFRGPVGTLDYTPNETKTLGLIAGGTGITPILQVITKVITNPEDKTELKVIFACQTPNQILLKLELDSIAEKYPKLSVYYTVDNPSEEWTGGVGYVSKEMIKTMFDDKENTKILMSGPPAMKSHINGLLDELDWDKEKVFYF